MHIAVEHTQVAIAGEDFVVALVDAVRGEQNGLVGEVEEVVDVAAEVAGAFVRDAGFLHAAPEKVVDKKNPSLSSG